MQERGRTGEESWLVWLSNSQLPALVCPVHCCCFFYCYCCSVPFWCVMCIIFATQSTTTSVVIGRSGLGWLVRSFPLQEAIKTLSRGRMHLWLFIFRGTGSSWSWFRPRETWFTKTWLAWFLPKKRPCCPIETLAITFLFILVNSS